MNDDELYLADRECEIFGHRETIEVCVRCGQDLGTIEHELPDPEPWEEAWDG